MGTVRALRTAGLVVASGVAIAVFIVGGRDGGEDWQVPALVLIGVLVIILHVATAPAAVSPGITDAARSAPIAAAGHVGVQPPAGPVVAPHGVDGSGHVVVPASSFPDAGHAHGPVIAVTSDRPPPPLRSVLRTIDESSRPDAGELSSGSS